jgi:hypothetical protein
LGEVSTFLGRFFAPGMAEVGARESKLLQGY